MGDFNISLLNSDINLRFEFFDNLSSHFFAPYLIQPTRLPKNFKNLIDSIFINTIKFDFYTGNFTSQLSNHLLKFLILPKKGSH